MRDQILDKIFVCFIRPNVNDIIHKISLVHILHKTIFDGKKGFKLVENTVRRKKISKLMFQKPELSKKGWKELPFWHQRCVTEVLLAL